MKKTINTLLAAFCLLAFTLPSTAYAVEVLKGPCDLEPNAVACQQRNQRPDNNSLYGTNGVITKITRLLAIIVGIAAVIMIIIGGLSYVLSSGDPNRVNSAKNMILYAIIGLIVAVVAQALVVYVLTKL